MYNFQPIHVFCLPHAYIGVPEQALGWFPLILGSVVHDESSKLSCRMGILY